MDAATELRGRVSAGGQTRATHVSASLSRKSAPITTMFHQPSSPSCSTSMASVESTGRVLRIFVVSFSVSGRSFSDSAAEEERRRRCRFGE